MMQEERGVARGRHCAHGTTHPRMHAIVKYSKRRDLSLYVDERVRARVRVLVRTHT